MKLSLNWLKDFVNINIPYEELALRLTNSGFEVEEIISESKGMERVLVGRIEKITKHPNAEKLSVCQINVGDKNLQILTAATNVFEGAYVPVATDGADLPCGVLIKTTNMRGLISEGMLCSGKELCIDDSVYPGAEIDGIMILQGEVTPGTCIAEVIGMDDVVLDVTVLSNRPDCNSVLGLAREIATMLNLPLENPELDYDITYQNIDFDIQINSPNCLRYMGAIVKNIHIAPSPDWMQKRLQAVGLNPINNIVDITNYVLMEIGQPMHAFDLDKVDMINVRQANNETLTLLNGEEYNLGDDVMVIADSNSPLAVAGVMGGMDASINADTKNILFESATFTRASIRSTSRKLALRSDSSARYERGVEPALNEMGLKRALHLIQTLNVGEIVLVKDNVTTSLQSKTLEINYNDINNLLGTTISQNKMQEILNSLNIQTDIQGQNLICHLPSYRTDIEHLADIAEEVIRICGLEEIQANGKKPYSTGNNILENVSRLKNILVESGAYEIKTYSLVDNNVCKRLLIDETPAIKVSNPLNDNLSNLRTTLMDSMLQTIAFNNSHNSKDLVLFEIGRKYLMQNDSPKETNTLCVAMSGKTDFFKLKTLLEKVITALNADITLKTDIGMPFNKYVSGQIFYQNILIGQIGEIHPLVLSNYNIMEKVYLFEIDLDDLFINNDKEYSYTAITKFPSVTRDLNFLVPNSLTFKTLYDEIVHSSGKYCKEVTLVDIYKGEQVEEGYSSFSFRLRFEKIDSTLTDAEVEQAVSRLLRSLEYKLKVTLRR